MELNRANQSGLIAKSYTQYSERVRNFILQKVNCRQDAENLTQDVWMRLLEYDRELSESTILKFLFTIARNLVNDYLRHLYCVEEAHAYLMESGSEVSDYEESSIVARDLADIERQRVESLPSQRKTIYIWSRYEDMSVSDISEQLSLSKRTVENHLRLGRAEVRAYMSAV